MWLLLPLLFACSTVHGVRPIGAGAVQVDASLGGPFVELFGAPVPLPLTTLGATVGVSDRTNVHAAAHITGALLFGIGAGDVGVSTELLRLEGARPRLMADVTVVGAGGGVSGGDPRFFARPTVTASWDWGRHMGSTLYTSLGAFVEPYPGPHALGTLALGNQFGLGRSARFTTQLEWIAPYANTEALTPTWYAPANLGAISLQLGLTVYVRAPTEAAPARRTLPPDAPPPTEVSP